MPTQTADMWMQDSSVRKDVIVKISQNIVTKFVDFTFWPTPEANHSKTEDNVRLYAIQAISFGIFYLEYSDAIREGDGDRVLRCWRYMLPMFISSGRKNYANEAMKLLWQHQYALSPRQAAQLLSSRFVNVHGLPGCNIPADLHMEHLNRVCKEAIKGLGANKTASN